ncbi:glycosyltransferase [Uliginosibacterium sp. 31-16]|uniref:glycosyltransferase n=1 Tax=Uliginosibacterium sp. 31-16 TaxID=3068315 RepID=UPI00273EFDFE|nr:glycosyltransferase [Uliginosibacterium sp. 31-16]MDP5240957.1 glycosyltransferase [Uliginosibacterium sp. 31-16]
MKILMISDVYFPRINGVSTSIETFRSELQALDIHTTLIAPAYPQDAEPPEPGVVRIPARFLPMDPEDRLMRRREIRHWLQQQPEPDFDLVHIQTPFAAHYAGLEIARALDVPVVTTYHTFFEEYLYHYIPFLPRSLMRAAARRFSRGQCNQLDAVVVPSQAMAAELRDYGVTRPLHILPTGLREERFSGGDGAAFRQLHGIAPERPLLLFVGRVAFEKNIGFLLEVVDRVRQTLPDVLLLVTGEGPALAGLRSQAAALGLNDHVRFLGYLDRRNALADCYRAADLFVFASRTETQGLVLLEAMALGCPVLALSVMGTREILEGAAGTVIAQDDVADFAAKSVALLADRVALKALGNAAAATARTWSAREMALRLGALYQDLIVRRAASSKDLQAGMPESSTQSG